MKQNKISYQNAVVIIKKYKVVAQLTVNIFAYVYNKYAAIKFTLLVTYQHNIDTYLTSSSAILFYVQFWKLQN